MPAGLPIPPADWRAPYRQLAGEVGLDADLDAGHAVVAALLDPIPRGDSMDCVAAVRIGAPTGGDRAGKWPSARFGRGLPVVGSMSENETHHAIALVRRRQGPEIPQRPLRHHLRSSLLLDQFQCIGVQVQDLENLCHAGSRDAEPPRQVRPGLAAFVHRPPPFAREVHWVGTVVGLVGVQRFCG